ncbi:MAG: hypothetical protein ACKO0V_05505 [bacterium]
MKFIINCVVNGGESARFRPVCGDLENTVGQGTTTLKFVQTYPFHQTG